jgi:hypothetical protein
VSNVVVESAEWSEKLVIVMNRRISVEMIVAPASEKANGVAAVTRLAGGFYNFSPSLRAISICPSPLYKTRILNGAFCSPNHSIKASYENCMEN